MKRFRTLLILVLALVFASVTAAQQNPVPASPAPGGLEILEEADAVMAEISALLKLPVKFPLKKSLRSREEIRAYVIQQFREEIKPEELHAEQVALTKFGLLPKGFELEPFLIDLLTEQVAGLYDPKGKEFYIADWLGGGGETRIVMAHELVHALHDQHFSLKTWQEAAKPSEDAQMARHAVAEGAATLVMLEFMMRDMGLPVSSARQMGDITVFLRSMIAGGLGESPQMMKAPGYIRDTLLFSYVEGAIFCQKVLKNGTGWEEFNRVYTQPPVNTQQVMHPELYLSGTVPAPVDLASAHRAVPRSWKKLDENHMGEFGLQAILKELLGKQIAEELAPAWAGDTYAVYEHQKTREALLLYRLRLQDEAAALRFFGVYSDALEKKYASARELFRRPNFFAFSTDEGGVFLHCAATDCLAVEGADRAVFDAVNRRLKRPAAPTQPQSSTRRIAKLPASQFGADGGIQAGLQ